MFSMINFIEKKRDGGAHSQEEFHQLIKLLLADKPPIYQLSAWLMAVYFKGLTGDEMMYLTEELAGSGDTYKFPPELKVVDKHSTGGVGDKASMIVLPAAAACGAVISKLSGPGLGITGGTVDKLESIPGMRVHLTREQFLQQLKQVHCAISGHSKELAPAEGIFYRTRDVTGTVPSIPLITTSILSKKLAGGASGFLFDVKCGSGAFEKDLPHARELAECLVNTTERLGKKSVALITDMDQPLGEWVGNSMEVYETIEVLNGRGPADTRALCIALCGEMLRLAGKAADAREGESAAANALDNGSALRKFEEIIQAQGGDVESIRNPLEKLPYASKSRSIKSDNDGYVTRMDASAVGEALRALGGGRLRIDDVIDHSAAVRVRKKVGDAVKTGDTVIELLYNEESKLKPALEYLNGSWSVGEEQKKRKLILDRIQL